MAAIVNVTFKELEITGPGLSNFNNLNYKTHARPHTQSY